MTPTEPGYWYFRGVRLVRNNQRVDINEPVQVLQIWDGRNDRFGTVLGVVMFGRQGRFPLSQFEGTWLPLGGDAS